MESEAVNLELLNRICDSAIVAERRSLYGQQKGHGFRDLRVWQAGMDLIEACYRASQAYPSSEQFGLTSQLRRAAVSIISNLAEGWGRNTNPEFARFVDISVGSLCEVESLVEVSKRLDYIPPALYTELIERANKVGSMLYRLRASLKELANEA